jgi:hypothetical protein
VTTMIKLALRSVRYALAALHAVGFAFSMN